MITFFRLTCSVVLWGGRNTADKSHWRVWGVLAVSRPHFPPAHGVCAFMVCTCQALGCSAENCLRRALGFMHFSGLSRSGSGSRVLHKDTDSVGPEFVPFPGPSRSGDQMGGEHSIPQVGGCVLSPSRSQLLSFLGGCGCTPLRCALCLLVGADLWLRPSWQMSTVQNP